MSESPHWFRRLTAAQRLAPFELRADVVAAAQAMVSDRRSDPQIVRLRSSLTETETVVRMMDGRHCGARGLLVLTNERVFFRPRQSDGPVAFSVRLSDADNIEGSTHKVVGSVRITSADGHYVVDKILGTQGEILAAEARDARLWSAARQRDPLEVLVELRALRDVGAITAEEFDLRKSELWGGI